jgi:hypothetical protein
MIQARAIALSTSQVPLGSPPRATIVGLGSRGVGTGAFEVGSAGVPVGEDCAGVAIGLSAGAGTGGVAVLGVGLEVDVDLAGVGYFSSVGLEIDAGAGPTTWATGSFCAVPSRARPSAAFQVMAPGLFELK